MIGARLGSFAIQSPLGAGGMGEVYRAHDTTLDRDVAIKILPEVWLADPIDCALRSRSAHARRAEPSAHRRDLRSRRCGDTRALVLELVEGPTLVERLERWPLAPQRGAQARGANRRRPRHRPSNAESSIAI